MAEKIKASTILIKADTLLPAGLPLESESYSKGWELLKNVDANVLDRKIRETGWTFFFMANEINATAVGSDLEKTTRRAVKKVIAHMKSDKFNCVEIVQVAEKRFLGLPYVAVSAHPRHIQESMSLFHSKWVAEWDRAKLAPTATKNRAHEEETVSQRMVIKPGLAENGGARFSGGRLL